LVSLQVLSKLTGNFIDDWIWGYRWPSLVLFEVLSGPVRFQLNASIFPLIKYFAADNIHFPPSTISAFSPTSSPPRSRINSWLATDVRPRLFFDAVMMVCDRVLCPGLCTERVDGVFHCVVARFSLGSELEDATRTSLLCGWADVVGCSGTLAYHPHVVA